MNKTQFDQIFKDAMQDTLCYNFYPDYDGKVISDKFNVEPHLAIRDFDIDTSDMQTSGVWDAGKIDKEFTNLNTAWEYFQSVQRYRLMTATGSILADSYIKEVSQ